MTIHYVLRGYFQECDHPPPPISYDHKSCSAQVLLRIFPTSQYMRYEGKTLLLATDGQTDKVSYRGATRVPPKNNNDTWEMNVANQMTQQIGLVKTPLKTFRWPWILRALISLKSVIMTKALKMIVKCSEGAARRSRKDTYVLKFESLEGYKCLKVLTVSVREE